MKHPSLSPNTLVARNRLKNLKLRMEQVAQSWTVGNYESLLKFYVNILPKIMGAERCTIYIVEMGSENICSIYGTGLEGKKIKPPREGSIAGRVISLGKSIIENNLDKRTGYHTRVAEKTGFISRNMICSPIKSVTSQGATGAIQVLNKKERSFAAADLVLLEECANHLSTSIESIIINQEILRISKQLNKEVERLDKEYAASPFFIAQSPAMREVLEQVRLVSQSPVNVLIHGENGTGKELVSRMIHRKSSRKNGPFVAINCAAVPEALVESEFFGHEKGAFTGADRSRTGRFEEARGGTLLLDEIADMPLTMQPKFLRAVEESEGCRLGSNKVVHYDFRIISASNKDLKTEVEKGRFREDLFFRLFSVRLNLPPLRERREDIVPLALHFFEKTCRRFQKKPAGFAPEVLNLFAAANWPGNIRQLKSEVERLVALTGTDRLIEINKCSPELLGQGQLVRQETDFGLAIPDQVRALEIRLIEKALEQTMGNKQKAAELLKITRQGLHKKLKRYQLSQVD